jgi:hypothetical protein
MEPPRIWQIRIVFFHFALVFDKANVLSSTLESRDNSLGLDNGGLGSTHNQSET